MQFPWYFFALAAAVLWGLQYALTDKLLEKVSAVTLVFLAGTVLYITAAFFPNRVIADLQAVYQSGPKMWLVLAGLLLAGVLADFAVFHAISAKNATLAGMIEISYPLFIMLFAFLLFGEKHLNLYSAMGGMLVLAGVGLIMLKG